MKSLVGTQTHKNLMKAFAGESQARNRYTFYGQVAKKQGYANIQKTFDLTATQEQMHAKIFFQFLAEEFNGQAIEIEADYPVDLYQEDTVRNLLASVVAETHEHEEIYPSFAKTAKDEGFPKIGSMFEMIAKIEEEHARRFAEIARELDDETFYKKSEPVAWHCQVCGHIHFGVSAPTLCPVCKHPKGHFQIEMTR